MHRSKLVLSLLATLALALAASQSYAAFTFTTIDDPSGVNGTLPNGIDGNNVVGGYYDAGFAGHGFLYNTSTQVWTTASTTHRQSTAPRPSVSRAVILSAAIPTLGTVATVFSTTP